MNPSGYVIQTAPTVEPVSLLEVKRHCRVDWDTEDARMESIITTARALVESHTGPLCTQTWDVYWTCFPLYGGSLRLPWGKFTAVTQFSHTPSSLTPDDWTVSGADLSYSSALTAHFDAVAKPSRITLAYNRTWPTPELKTVNPIRARVTGGYGAASAVPERIKSAILLLCDYYYRNRSQATDQMPRHIELGVFSLIQPYRALV